MRRRSRADSAAAVRAACALGPLLPLLFQEAAAARGPAADAEVDTASEAALMVVPGFVSPRAVCWLAPALLPTLPEAPGTAARTGIGCGGSCAPPLVVATPAPGYPAAARNSCTFLCVKATTASGASN